MKLNKNINYKLLSLYLKYGYISLPGFRTIYKNRKINKWINPPYKTNLNTSTEEVLLYMKKRFERFVKKQKKEGKYICLLLSAGQDSGLIYQILKETTIKLNYQNFFFCYIGKISHSNYDYDESFIIKKFWKKKPLNLQVININKDDIFKKIFLANQINFQPVNGLPNIIYMSCVEKICKKFGKKNVNIVTGVGDQIFFNALKKQAKNQQNKGSSLINANDGTIFNNSSYLTPNYERFADELHKRIKTKKFLKERHFFHKYINQMNFNYRGPKVITEFTNIFKYFKVSFFAPFIEKKFCNLILSLKKDHLHNGSHKKSFIFNANNMMYKNEKKIPGLKIITPQREILYNKKKEILQIIKTSYLCKIGMVDKKIILREFENYLKDYDKYKKNTKKFRQFNSYSIWKFLSSEIFLRSCK